MSPRSQSPLTLENILLGFLDQTPMHGYDLYRKVSQLALIWHIKQSHLYALLDKLEQQGLLASQVIPGETHPARKEYHTTPAGQQAFTAWIDSPVQHGRDIRQEFLAKLYFARQAGPESERNLLDRQQAICFQWLQDFEAALAAADEQHEFEKKVILYRIYQVRAIIVWLEDCRS